MAINLKSIIGNTALPIIFQQLGQITEPFKFSRNILRKENAETQEAVYNPATGNYDYVDAAGNFVSSNPQANANELPRGLEEESITIQKCMLFDKKDALGQFAAALQTETDVADQGKKKLLVQKVDFGSFFVDADLEVIQFPETENECSWGIEDFMLDPSASLFTFNLRRLK